MYFIIFCLFAFFKFSVVGLDIVVVFKLKSAINRLICIGTDLYLFDHLQRGSYLNNSNLPSSNMA